MNNPKPNKTSSVATFQDIQRLFGDLDAATVSAIVALSPSIAEVEEAALWVAGEGETIPKRHQPRGKVKAVLDLVEVDEDEERMMR